MAIVTMRYWAAAKQAAGLAEESLAADTLAEAFAEASARHVGAPDFDSVLARSSFLVDGEQVSARAPESVVLADGAVVEVLPPFAGG